MTTPQTGRQPASHVTRYSMAGLDDRDLALIAGACTDLADHLARLAAGHPANDPTRAALDAERLRYIANALRRRNERGVADRPSQ